MVRELDSVVVAWSGGKDSALALSRLLNSSHYKVVGLLTTISLPYDRVTMHGVRRSLVQRQASLLGLPLHIVWLPPNPSNEIYDALMRETLVQLKAQGVSAIAFGDLFLEDVRAYRETRLAEVSMKGIFPLWGTPSEQVIAEFLALGYEAIVTCVDTKVLPPDFCGRWLDDTFFAFFPQEADLCGENGEYHTFVTASPFFPTPIRIRVGQRVYRDRFVYCELESVAG